MPGAGAVTFLGSGTFVAGRFAEQQARAVDDYKAANVTTAQVLALFTTPVSLGLTLPGAGKIIVPTMAVIHKPAGTAYAGIAVGEELSIGWIGGAEVFQVSSTGFLDQATAQRRVCLPHASASGAGGLTPSVNTGLEIKLLVGNITTGTSALIVEVYFKVINDVPSLF